MNFAMKTQCVHCDVETGLYISLIWTPYFKSYKITLLTSYKNLHKILYCIRYINTEVLLINITSSYWLKLHTTKR